MMSLQVPVQKITVLLLKSFWLQWMDQWQMIRQLNLLNYYSCEKVPHLYLSVFIEWQHWEQFSLKDRNDSIAVESKLYQKCACRVVRVDQMGYARVHCDFLLRVSMKCWPVFLVASNSQCASSSCVKKSEIIRQLILDKTYVSTRFRVQISLFVGTCITLPPMFTSQTDFLR